MVKMVWVFGRCCGRFKRLARHVLGRFPRVGAVTAPLSHDVDAPATCAHAPGHAWLAAVVDSPVAQLPHLAPRRAPSRRRSLLAACCSLPAATLCRCHALPSCTWGASVALAPWSAVVGVLVVCALDGSRTTAAAAFSPAAPLPTAVTSRPSRARARAPAINSSRSWARPDALLSQLSPTALICTATSLSGRGFGTPVCMYPPSTMPMLPSSHK